MKNPFLFYSETCHCEYLTRLSSLNRIPIAKVPVKGIDDGIQGKISYEVFRTKLIIDDIKKQAAKRNIDISGYQDHELPKFLDEGLESGDIRIKTISTEIAVKYGNRLGLILLTLKTGFPENRKAKDDWNDTHWEYWANIKTIILVGGLASGTLGKFLKSRIQYVFDSAGVKPYNLIIFENGSQAGTMGCAMLIKEKNTRNLVFDFGHTNIKRVVVQTGPGGGTDILHMEAMPSMPAINTEDHIADEAEKHRKAKELHKYLINVVYETYKEARRTQKLGREIVISIANYTVGGSLNKNSGGYEKLTVLGSDYAKILSDELSALLHKQVMVKLIHDGTAMGLYFHDYEDAVCISLGTSFGTGMPDIKLN